MKKTITAAAIAVMTALTVHASNVAFAAAQDKPAVVKGNLPRKAVCLVCSQHGEGHGEEKPAGAVAYKGKTYYFCNKKEVEAFVKDPEAFVPPVLPRSAPAANLKTLTGGATTFSGMKGKVLLVDFWATWCKPCIAVMPDLQKLHDRYAGRGFAVVGVSIDEGGAKDVQPFLARRKQLTYPMLLDQNGVWEKWGVRAIPAMFLVDRDGRIVRQWTGKVDKKEVERAVAALLK